MEVTNNRTAAQPPVGEFIQAGACPDESSVVLSGPEHLENSAANSAENLNGHGTTAQIAAQKPPKLPGKTGAPFGNSNRLVHGERSKLSFRKAKDSDTYMTGRINEWRRDLEAKILEKFGEISLYQEAKIVTALQWEAARRRRNQLCNEATTKAEEAQHEEAAGVNCERRDRALELAGLAGQASSFTANSRHVAADDSDDDLPPEALEAAK
jgi:hypothetical protein